MENRLTPEQLAKIHAKDASTPEALQRDPLTNYREGYFHVTLSTRDKSPVLGWMAGLPHVPRGNADVPHVVLSELGEKVKEVWERNPSIYPGVENVAFQIMPEHVHLLWHLTKGNTKHLGHIVKGFMIGCSHGYWDTLGLPWREQGYVKGVRTPEYNDCDHTHSNRGPALFVHGYNDVEAVTTEEVAIKIEYIRANPERRVIKENAPDVFRVRRGLTSSNWTRERAFGSISSDPFFGRNDNKCRVAQNNVAVRMECKDRKPVLAYMGDAQLLFAERKVPLVCHKKDLALFEQQKEAVLKAARDGAVVVSAFISERERDIRSQLMQEQLPIVEILDNGFDEKYKPLGKAFYATAERRLVQVSPWTHIYRSQDVTISREMCLVMNELVRLLCSKKDDWWKD